jgi:hypothetical protein
MTLENPPKFVDCAPKTIVEWKLFFRWLTNLSKSANDSIKIMQTQTLTINQSPAPAVSRDYSDKIEARSLVQSIPQISKAEERMPSIQVMPNRSESDSLTGIVLNAISRPARMQADYSLPIGSVYLSVVSTDPASLLGYGTWSQIAQGEMLVGYKTGDADFGTVEATGGSKTMSAAHTSTTAAISGSGTTLLTGPATHTNSIINPYFVIYIWKRTA